MEYSTVKIINGKHVYVDKDGNPTGEEVFWDEKEDEQKEDSLPFGEDKQGEVNEKLEKGLQVLEGGEDNYGGKSLYKQSREILDSTSYSIGRGKRSKKLLPTTNHMENIPPKLISFLDYLIYKWQNNASYLDSEGFLLIDNLSKFARDYSEVTGNKTIPARIKEYLYLSSIPLPCILNKNKIGDDVYLEVGYKPLFEIKATLKVSGLQGDVEKGFKSIEEYSKIERNAIYGPIKIRPTETYCNSIGKDIYGKDLPIEIKEATEGRGNTFLSKKTISFEDNLSDYAKKLFRYTASNTPTSRLGFKKLVKQLNLEKERRDKGYKGIKRDIELAFEELKKKGHFKVWRYNNTKGEYDGFYSWTYTDKYVKHEYFPKKKQIAEKEEKRTLDEKQQRAFMSEAWEKVRGSKKLEGGTWW